MIHSRTIRDTIDMGIFMGKQELKVKPSYISNNLAVQVAEEELKNTDSSETLKVIYTNLMHQLEMDGISKNDVSTVGQKIVVAKKQAIRKREGAGEEELKKINIGRWWFTVAKELKYINLKFSHEIGAVAQRKIVPLSNYEQENSEYLEIINDTINFLKDVVKPTLLENHFMSLLTEEHDKVRIALHDWKAQLEIAESFFDHKEKIPANTHHILLHAIGTKSSNNDAAVEYMRLRDQAHTITSKQISKYRNGMIKIKLGLFNPKDRITAVLWKYFRVPCTKCESWRVTEVSQKPDKTIVKCMDCENTFDAKATSKCNYCSFPYFEEDIEFIKKESRCPNCKEELPEYLINHIVN